MLNPKCGFTQMQNKHELQKFSAVAHDEKTRAKVGIKLGQRRGSN
jgi:hypothetical protein